WGNCEYLETLVASQTRVGLNFRPGLSRVRMGRPGRRILSRAARCHLTIGVVVQRKHGTLSEPPKQDEELTRLRGSRLKELVLARLSPSLDPVSCSRAIPARRCIFPGCCVVHPSPPRRLCLGPTRRSGSWSQRASG